MIKYSCSIGMFGQMRYTRFSLQIITCRTHRRVLQTEESGWLYSSSLLLIFSYISMRLSSCCLGSLHHSIKLIQTEWTEVPSLQLGLPHPIVHLWSPENLSFVKARAFTSLFLKSMRIYCHNLSVSLFSSSFTLRLLNVTEILNMMWRLMCYIMGCTSITSL